MVRYEIRVAGFGGQGVITLSKMIVMASSIYENLAATQTEAYSASARGGMCWGEVVVDLNRDVKYIDYPKALEPYDFLIVLSEESARNIKANQLKKGDSGFLLWDPSTIQKFKAVKRIPKALSIPVQKIARERFGNIVFGNSILFGAFTALAQIFSEESALETIKQFVPQSTIDTNMEAFELGKQEAQEFLKKLQEENN